MATWRLVNGRKADVDGVQATVYDLMHDGEYVLTNTVEKAKAHAKEHGQRLEWFADGHKSVRLADIGKAAKTGKGRR